MTGTGETLSVSWAKADARPQQRWCLSYGEWSYGHMGTVSVCPRDGARAGRLSRLGRPVVAESPMSLHVVS
jgi:hypothetical protein